MYIQRSFTKTCRSCVGYVLLFYCLSELANLGFIAKFDITNQRTRAMSSVSWSRCTRFTCLTSGPPRGKTEMETAYKHEGGKVTASGIGQSIGILRLAHQLLRTHYYQTSQHFTPLLNTTGSERAKLRHQSTKQKSSCGEVRRGEERPQRGPHSGPPMRGISAAAADSEEEGRVVARGWSMEVRTRIASPLIRT